MEIQKVEDYIIHRQLFKHDKPVLVALSGGIDSFVMSDILIKLNYSVVFAHCNFQLRGDESDLDEKFVSNIANEWNIPIRVIRFKTTEYATENSLSTQESARKLRYDWFKELISEHNYQCVATAHNADDVAETLLINLGRGCGIAGLRGIPVKNGDIVRPILFVSRMEIEEYARESRIRFRNDSSNFERKYTRNKIRHDIIPILKTIFPGFIENITQSTELICKQEDIYNIVISQYSKHIVENNNKTEVELTPFIHIENSEVILYELLKPFHFSLSQVKNIILQGIENNGCRFDTFSHQAITHSGKLLIKNADSNILKDEYLIENLLDFNNLPILLNIENISKNEISELIPQSKNQIFVDYSKLVFPLKIRHWKKGDRIYPYGLNGSKKIQDLFSDLKLNLFQKKEVWILESDQKIVWVIGIKPDKHFSVSTNTEQILKFTVY